ncbi:hypothetical protein RIF29_40998 [Crotalaria pallida]|uniref:Thiolase N-terminal domain-containing protein n=1 Tax=Crotalaria pallida TaxID=3830 RepID=A0AAN9E481_CROPI
MTKFNSHSCYLHLHLHHQCRDQTPNLATFTFVTQLLRVLKLKIWKQSSFICGVHHYEIAYLIHEKHAGEVAIVNEKIQGIHFEELSIQLGINDVVAAGGMESMSNVPKKGSHLGHDSLVDGMLKDRLWDLYKDVGMGVCVELCADNHAIPTDVVDEDEGLGKVMLI